MNNTKKIIEILRNDFQAAVNDFNKRLDLLSERESKPELPDDIVEAIQAFKVGREILTHAEIIYRDIPKREWVEKHLYYENPIHSVSNKQGELFSVGEQANHHDIQDKPHSVDMTLEDFYISDGGDLCYNSDKLKNGLVRGLRKPLKPVILTEDGKEIFDINQKVYRVNTTHFNYHILEAKFYEDKPFWKWFSTEQAANQYILDNSKRYSLKDIEKVLTVELTGWYLSEVAKKNILNELSNNFNQ